jgi:hypothetical protein
MFLAGDVAGRRDKSEGSSEPKWPLSARQRIRQRITDFST